jgi:deoxyribodipyrimidine photo-lyase
MQVSDAAAPVTGMTGGTREATRTLRRFLRERLSGYASNRNHPELDGTSQLSPYLHFGHIGPRTIARAIRDADAPREDREAFLEEFIVRRELAINFVRFNPRYDRLEGCEPWALRTLAAHADDPRRPCYTSRQLEQAETHDPLWNAAQIQMVATGWMHGYVRMYWAKKILEWTRDPVEAFAIAVTLNDRYQLDGRDPNGYAGIAWAIGGKHDRAWGPQRPIYGMVRYMSFASTSRKFDYKAYVRRVEMETGLEVAGQDEEGSRGTRR